MAPSLAEAPVADEPIAKQFLKRLPPKSRERLERAGVDLSKGYPWQPENPPRYIDEVLAIRNVEREHVDAGSRADPEKKALFSAAKQVIDLTKHIGTEIVGLQLTELTNQQKDELALLIAERGVVFFRDQELDPRQQLELGQYYGEIEAHPMGPQVPGLAGVTVLWPDYNNQTYAQNAHFRKPGGAARWHSDLVHEKHPAGITHLHNDTIPKVGGDTLWASGYAAYEKLSLDFRKLIDGKYAVYYSNDTYLVRGNETAGPKHVERTHPMVRVHPVTGWKALWVNRAMTSRIVGLDKPESDLLLNYLYDVYEKNVDIQVRFRWTPGTSAIWDNRVTIHNASWDYEGSEARHGTRVTALAEKPFFRADAPTRREALGLANLKLEGYN